jgi:hypothetical protein
MNQSFEGMPDRKADDAEHRREVSDTVAGRRTERSLGYRAAVR